jgi:hypothetical protein
VPQDGAAFQVQAQDQALRRKLLARAELDRYKGPDGKTPFAKTEGERRALAAMLAKNPDLAPGDLERAIGLKGPDGRPLAKTPDQQLALAAMLAQGVKPDVLKKAFQYTPPAGSEFATTFDERLALAAMLAQGVKPRDLDGAIQYKPPGASEPLAKTFDERLALARTLAQGVKPRDLDGAIQYKPPGASEPLAKTFDERLALARTLAQGVKPGDLNGAIQYKPPDASEPLARTFDERLALARMLAQGLTPGDLDRAIQYPPGASEPLAKTFGQQLALAAILSSNADLKQGLTPADLERAIAFKPPDGHRPFATTSDEYLALAATLAKNPGLKAEDLARSQEWAQLCNAAYPGTRAPDGYERVDEQPEFANIPQFNQVGRRAELYRHKVNGEWQYVLVFPGLRDGAGHGEDVRETLGQGGIPFLPKEQYYAAIELGLVLQRKLGSQFVGATGHSHGGAEAAALAMATGRQAITFNAEGLRTQTLTDAEEVLRKKGWDVHFQWNESGITNYRVEGDPLTSDQETGFSSLFMKPAAGSRQITVTAFDGDGHIINSRQKLDDETRHNLHNMYNVFRGMLVDTHAQPGVTGQALPAN